MARLRLGNSFLDEHFQNLSACRFAIGSSVPNERLLGATFGILRSLVKLYPCPSRLRARVRDG